MEIGTEDRATTHTLFFVFPHPNLQSPIPNPLSRIPYPLISVIRIVKPLDCRPASLFLRQHHRHVAALELGLDLDLSEVLQLL